MLNHATLLSLAAFPEQLAQFYNAIPADYTHWVPPSWEGVPSEEFSAIEQICHVRDIERDGYQVRFRRALEEDLPVLGSLDGHRLSIERRYSEANAVEVLAAVRRERAETLKILANLSPEQWRRTAVFDGYGQLTVRSLAHYLCSHDQQHLAGLQWLLGKIEGL
jgi:hypothetical protein